MYYGREASLSFWLAKIDHRSKTALTDNMKYFKSNQDFEATWVVAAFMSEFINDAKESNSYSHEAVGIIIANYQMLLLGLAWTDGRFGSHRKFICGYLATCFVKICCCFFSARNMSEKIEKYK